MELTQMPRREDDARPSYEVDGSDPIACPGCRSYRFNISGCVAYTQLYNSKTGDYGESDISWDGDWEHSVVCANCERDVTALFRTAGSEFYRHVRAVKKAGG